MAKFCRYCGTKLEEGINCTCELALQQQAENKQAQESAAGAAAGVAGAVTAESKDGAAAQQAAMAEQAEAPQQTTAPQQDTAQQQSAAAQKASAAQQAAAEQATVFLGEAKSMVMGFINDPSATFKAALSQTEKKFQFALGGAYILIAFLAFLIFCNIKLGSYRTYMDISFLKYAIYTALIMAVNKIVVVGTTFLMAKKKQEGLTFQNVLGVFCVATIPETILIVLAFLLCCLSLYQLGIIVLVVNSAAAVITSVFVVLEICGDDKKTAYFITLIAYAAQLVIASLFMNSMMNSMLEASMGSLMRWY